MDIIFATQNKHKVAEINHILKATDFSIVTMGAMGFLDDIPETGVSLEENALIKARYLKDKLDAIIMSEDTGLEIEALGGAPGVHTARYAGDSKDADNNMALVLKNLADKTNRSAQFRTVIALILGGNEILFEGIVRGKIAFDKKGSGGFGYDPIFIPNGFTESFAEMGDDIKKNISHRALAIHKLVHYLNSK
jgi:XTP/dITP diphosphohydrolase